MKERTTTLAAGAIAIALVAGVSTMSLRRRDPSLAPRFLGQKLVVAKDGTQTIELTLMPPDEEVRPKPEPDEDPMPIEFRLVDRRGRLYHYTVSYEPKPFVLVVPRTYGRPVEQPRVVAYYNDQPRGSIDLPPFPAPVLRSLNPKPDPQIRASLERRDYLPMLVGTGGGGPCVVFRPLTPLPKDQCWDVRVLQTNIALEGKIGGQLNRMNPDQSECLFAPFYVKDVDAVRIHVVRRHRKVVSEDVVIPGLRLATKAGKQVFDLKKPTPVANRLGIRLTVEQYNPGPYDPNSGPLSPKFQYKTLGPLPLSSLPPGQKLPWSYEATVKPASYVQLLGPMPEELGLDNIAPLTFQGMVREAGRRRPLEKGPFDLRVRLYKITWKTLGAFDATIPVEQTNSTRL